MQLPNVLFQNTQNENNKYMPGCWRLWRGPQTWWDWGRQTEASGRKDMGFGWSYCRTLQSLCQIKLKGAYAAIWKDTCSGVLPLLSSPIYCLCQRGCLSVWVLSWSAPSSLQRTALTRNTVGAKGKKCRTPCVHQVSVEIVLTSSQDFLCHWRNPIKSSHYFDFIPVRIKLTIPQRCLFLSFIGKLE